MILRLGQEINKMSLEYLRAPECKEVFKETIVEGKAKEHRSQLKELPVGKARAIRANQVFRL